ncbi:retron system putative HNH endonuclease [Clostridium sp.]|uniref:retron system putative HNH endonuclease n=1 Tax=Clostridium sp. TaxID=1506 RepID=UPI002841A378|nr:retron system putative HNH endonuclease [Clostridium sp.]MDR3594430.1 TIGR02646 family protein [Clostridium sp.]
MLKINKENEPEFLLEYKRKNSPKAWKDYESEIKDCLKSFILEKEQYKYCERTIYELSESHIEHIKPRDKFPKSFQEYNNIIVSCNNKHICGMKKGKDYNEEFIHPVLENPDEYLDFNLANGEIIPKFTQEETLNYKRAKYTIEILNLNDYKLKEARKTLIDSLEVYKEYYDDFNEYLQFFLDDKHSFPNLIKYYMQI